MYHDLNSEKAVSLRLIYEDHPILSDLAISEITKEVDINSDSIDSTIEKYKKILVKLRQFEDFIERNNYCVKIVHLPDFTIILGEGEHLTTRKLDIYIKLITDKVQFIIDEIIKSHNKNEYIVNYFKKAFKYTLKQIKSLRNSDKYDNYEEVGSYAKEYFIRIAEILFYVGKPHLNKVIDQIKNDIRIFNSSSDNRNDYIEKNILPATSPKVALINNGVDTAIYNEDRVARDKVKVLSEKNRSLKRQLSFKHNLDPNQLEQLINKARHPKTKKFSYRKLGHQIGCTHTTAKAIVERYGLVYLTADPS